jgi:hypothetical protein
MKRALIAVAMLALIAAPVVAQRPANDMPRTSDGHPDFQGVWNADFLTSLERAPDVKSLVVDDKEAQRLVDRIRAGFQAQTAGIDPENFILDRKELLRVNGEWRSSFVTSPADGRMPYLPSVRADMKTHREIDSSGAADGPEMRDTYERCLAGVGRAPHAGTVAGPEQIVQTTDSLMLYTERGGDVRIIGIGAQHRPAALVSFMGDSIARWEGDTLVVETTGVREGYGIAVGPKSRVIERFKLLGRNELNYQFTVEDKDIYSEPWSAEYSLTRSNEPIYEFACHEGNYGLTYVLEAARRRDRAAAEAAKKP